ncbi:M20/M25/M40 family metallo-hydrolase [Paracoccus onubensis]|uniref:M20/M25/M40 family metallo-hydrolase n=1 Tax=Paracoccus onubensis TaxID=1675788 RepID=A0A418SU58_9RHOB|nr:M20/M25/M40 family metallo-hydrolase [Paracoccus onubensis]RJE84475.1 M20/M25/M40 family metallo-hydrolase [Paracoccus onubensis]
MNAYLDREDVRDRNIKELIEFLRMPTVSARGEMKPMQDAAHWLMKRLQGLGAETQLLDSTGFPIVYGEIKGDSDKSVLFYNHYDVQPVEPLEAWSSDPFEPQIRDGILFGRGADDNKGSLISRIHAVEAILKERGSLPVTVKFLFEGEEESGSASLPATVEKYRDLLRADACIWENARRDDAGNPTTTLGNKGMFSFELRVRTASADSHSGKANIYPNAIWRLVTALSSMKAADGSIAIDGLMDAVGDLTEAEAEICRNTPANGPQQARKLGLETLLPGNDDFAVNKALFYTPSLNIQGIEGGYTGPGHKTVNPSTALARLECRLVKNQDPDEVERMIQKHLASRGYDDIEVVSQKAGAWPSYTAPDDPFVKTVAGAAAKVYDKDIVILPSSPGTGPRFIFRYQPQMPIAALGVGHANSRAHAPDENVAVEDQHLTTKHVAQILRDWAEAGA